MASDQVAAEELRAYLLEYETQSLSPPPPLFFCFRKRASGLPRAVYVFVFLETGPEFIDRPESINIISAADAYAYAGPLSLGKPAADD